MKKLLVTIIAAVGLLVTAQAALIDLGTTAGNPASLSAEMSRLGGQIDLYNAAFDPDLIKPTDLWSATKTETPDGGTSITLNLSGFDGYMVMKWGNENRFYYVNDLTHPTTDLSSVSYLGDGLYEFYSDVYATPKGGSNLLGVKLPLELSHYSSFTAVPEPASSTMAMLCVALGFVHFLRRKV